jgi:hypothetical protein
MRPIALRDIVTDQIHAFVREKGPSLVREVQDQSLTRPSGIIVAFDPVSEDPSRVYKHLVETKEQIERIYKQNDFARLLILFRKMLHELALKFLAALGIPRDNIDGSFRSVYPEALLFGTNCILKFGRTHSSLQSNNDRYHFQPIDSELQGAARLFLLSLMHRLDLFYMNSIMRRDLVSSPVSFDVLLQIYNKRLERRWTPRRNEDILTDAIVLPGSVYQMPLPRRVFECWDSAGSKYLLTFINHIPQPCNAKAELARYSFLDSPDFEVFTGVPFSKFWVVWVALNRLLMETFPILWPEYYFSGATREVLETRLTQMDDYCETALGGGIPASILGRCHEILAKQSEGCPDKADCAAVIEFLTCRKFEGDIRFTEKPFAFYPVNDCFVIWDYYRHGGLLRCLARELTRRARTKPERERATCTRNISRLTFQPYTG